MGGMGSGGRNRLSDAEKKKRGTFRPSLTDEAYNAKAAEKVITGPWLKAIPDPSIPLNDVGKKKYDEIAKLLLDGNKLTQVTCGDVERYAVMHQQMHARLEAGKPVSMDLIKRMDSISVRLRIAEDAPAIANPNQKNKFAGSGFSNSRSSPFRLRTSAKTGTGEL